MSEIDFAGRVAVVTGAGNGLGREYALRLAERGAAVVVNDVGAAITGDGTSPEPADQVVREIHAAGGRAVACPESVATRAGGEAIVETALVNFGRLDIVINNAGNQRNARFELMTDAEFDQVLDVHLKGAFFVSQAAYRVMLRQNYGRFVFTSSASALFGNYIRANYAAAKAGLVGLMHAIAVEGERAGILANAVLPVAASRLGGAAPGMMHPDWEARDPRTLPGMALLGPAMTPAHVAPLVVYLCSDRCTSTHAMWSAVAGRYAKLLVGAAPGWLAPAGAPPSPEDIEAHLSEIEDRTGYGVPRHVTDELRMVIDAYRARKD